MSTKASKGHGGARAGAGRPILRGMVRVGDCLGLWLPDHKTPLNVRVLHITGSAFRVVVEYPGSQAYPPRTEFSIIRGKL